MLLGVLDGQHGARSQGAVFAGTDIQAIGSACGLDQQAVVGHRAIDPPLHHGDAGGIQGDGAELVICQAQSIYCYISRVHDGELVGDSLTDCSRARGW